MRPRWRRSTTACARPTWPAPVPPTSSPTKWSAEWRVS